MPDGYLSTSGNQIVDAGGRPVRIASIGWYGTEGPAGHALQGLWAASYREILQSIKDDGFNTVRIPWSNVNLDVRPSNTNRTGTIDFRINPDLRGLTTREIFRRIVAYAGEIGLKVIFDHHTDDGSGGQQPNGLWIDQGPGTDGTDGAGVAGTVDAARFQADWVRFARMFAGNSTVIGFDLDNEPTEANAHWGGGGPTDILAMYEAVGNAVQAADPGALIIVEGPGAPYPAGGQDLSGALANPVVLKQPNKVVYSVHEYPIEIGGQQADSGTAFIGAMNRRWGYLETRNIAPVWIGEMGSNMRSADARAWAGTLLPYMNGALGSRGGPTFTGSQQPIGGSWWNIGSEGGSGNPDGTQTEWGRDHFKPEQQAVTDQMLFRPRGGCGHARKARGRRSSGAPTPPAPGVVAPLRPGSR